MSKVLKGLAVIVLASTISAGAAGAHERHGGGGHWHGGGGHWHGGGWGGGGFAVGAVLGGLLAAPYYGGYYGGPYYGYYDGPYGYGDCYITRRWVFRHGYRVLRRVRVCD